MGNAVPSDFPRGCHRACWCWPDRAPTASLLTPRPKSFQASKKLRGGQKQSLSKSNKNQVGGPALHYLQVCAEGRCGCPLETWASLQASALVCDHLLARLLPGAGSHESKGTELTWCVAPRDYSREVVEHPTASIIPDLRPVAVLSPGAKSWHVEPAVCPGSLPHAASCTWATLWLCLGPARSPLRL